MTKTPDDSKNELLDEFEKKGMYIEMIISPRIIRDKVRKFISAVLEMNNVNVTMEHDHFYYVYLTDNSTLQKQSDDIINSLITEFHDVFIRIMEADALLRYGKKYAQDLHDSIASNDIQVFIQRGGLNLSDLISAAQTYIVASKELYEYVM